MDGNQKVAVSEFEREFINRTCLSSDFVRRQVQARVRSEQLWRELRSSGRFILPVTEHVERKPLRYLPYRAARTLTAHGDARGSRLTQPMGHRS